MVMPLFVKRLFWEYDVNSLDFVGHKRFIVERVLEKGNSNSLKWLFRCYSISEIKNIIETSVNLSTATKNFWNIYFINYNFS